MQIEFSPEIWVIIHTMMVTLTMFLIAGIRKLTKKKVDGPYAVIVVGTIVGIGVSFALAAATGGPLDWTRIPIGAAYAAAAFGYANWKQWAKALANDVPAMGAKKERRERQVACSSCGSFYLNATGDYCQMCGTKFTDVQPPTPREGRVKRGGAAALICLAVLSTGCPAISSILPTVMNVISTVQDATLIVEQIVEWVDDHFTASPDPVREAQVKQAIQDVRSALLVANRAAQAGQSEEEAMDAFRTAYGRLLNLLGGMPGVKLDRREAYSADGTVDLGIELVSEKTGRRLAVPSPFKE